MFLTVLGILRQFNCDMATVPSDVPMGPKLETILQAYNLHLSACKSQGGKKCIEHPNCFNKCRSGPKSLSLDASAATPSPAAGRSKALDTFRIQDPARKPVGLFNLGSTCYIATLLQTLFHDYTFRDSLLRCESEDPIMVALKNLFIRMQCGTRAVESPKELIDLLTHDTQGQHDIHEFTRLFVSYLEHHMDEESLFRGRYVHTTTCKECGQVTKRGSSFHELALPLSPRGEIEGSSLNAISQGTLNLSQLLQQYLEPEELDGDNQYFCSGACDRKVSATRRLFIEDLPPVLNIQLLRFVYDASTHVKTKLGTAIKLPLNILMESDGKPQRMYDLQAVVSHFGASTNSGHYITDIHDAVSDSWWRMDDGTVSPITVSPGSKEGLHWRLTTSPRGTPMYTSRDAYMLVYKRRDRTVVRVPRALPATVERLQKEELEGMKNAKLAKLNDIRLNEFVFTRKELVKTVWKTIAPAPFAPDAYIISANWLTSWVLGDYLNEGSRKQHKEDPNEDMKKTRPGRIINRHLICQHGKLDPDRRNDMVRISGQAWAVLSSTYGCDMGFQWGNGFSILCSDCSQRRLQQDAEQAQLRAQLVAQTEALKPHVQTLPDFKRGLLFPSASKPPATGNWNLIPEAWRRTWQAYVNGEALEKPSPLDTSDLICKHDKLLYSPFPDILHFKRQSEYPPSKPGILCEVSPSEYKILVEEYGIVESSPVIEMTVKDPEASTLNEDAAPKKGRAKYRSWNAISLNTNPEVCLECSIAKHESQVAESSTGNDTGRSVRTRGEDQNTSAESTGEYFEAQGFVGTALYNSVMAIHTSSQDTELVEIEALQKHLDNSPERMISWKLVSDLEAKRRLEEPFSGTLPVYPNKKLRKVIRSALPFISLMHESLENMKYSSAIDYVNNPY